MLSYTGVFHFFGAKISTFFVNYMNEFVAVSIGRNVHFALFSTSMIFSFLFLVLSVFTREHIQELVP